MLGAVWIATTTSGAILRKKFTHPPKLPGESKRRAEVILWDLYLRGPVEDPSGHAMDLFKKRLAKIGWPMSTHTVNRIVDGFGDRDGQHSDLYPHNYIARDINGKRTYKVALIVDPEKVAFPDNPFEDEEPQTAEKAPKGPPVFLGTGTLAPRKPRPQNDDAGETFARQRQFEGDIPEPAPELELEPEPELVDEIDEIETEPIETAPFEPEPVAGALEPYRNGTSVRTNGTDPLPDDEIDLDDLGDLPEDLLEGQRPQTAMDMVAAAISLLSDSMAAHASEQTHLATDVLDRHIDERLGEYRLLQDRLARTEAKLRHTITQYEKAVGIARKQRQQLIAMKKELLRYRPTASTSS